MVSRDAIFLRHNTMFAGGRMKQIDTLFDRMDAWRHLPNYQLERRADIFFAMYLPEGHYGRGHPSGLD